MAAISEIERDSSSPFDEFIEICKVDLLDILNKFTFVGNPDNIYETSSVKDGKLLISDLLAKVELLKKVDWPKDKKENILFLKETKILLKAINRKLIILELLEDEKKSEK